MCSRDHKQRKAGQRASCNNKQQQTTANNSKHQQTTTNNNKQQQTTNSQTTFFQRQINLDCDLFYLKFKKSKIINAATPFEALPSLFHLCPFSGRIVASRAFALFFHWMAPTPNTKFRLGPLILLKINPFPRVTWHGRFQQRTLCARSEENISNNHVDSSSSPSKIV